MGISRNRSSDDGGSKMRFKVAAVFSNHMVLQRDKDIQVFGEGVNGEQVTVTFAGESVTALVIKERWIATLSPKSAATDLTMTVSCGKETIVFDDIAIGEVWLAGGQSNMEFELQNCTGGKDFLHNGTNSNVRFYYTQKYAYKDEDFYAAEQRSGWNRFSEMDAACWSAIGYLYAKRLAAELGVTVGIIGCNWGGTSASAWMDSKNLMDDVELRSYVDEYDEAVKGKTVEQQIKEYKEYQVFHAEWEKKSNAVYAKNPDATWDEVQEICGPCQWPGPMCCIHPYRPGGLYECMLQRVMPYTLRGFIYYQGESDDHKPSMYYKLFSRMILQWRQDWSDLELPFLYVQLPMHRYKQDEDKKNWCLIREAQMQTYQMTRNTELAVCIDCGEFNDIHPKDKVPVANRLALLALSKVYGKLSEKEAMAPMYQSLRKMDSSLMLQFKNADDGFLVKDEEGNLRESKEAHEFEIAGLDKEYKKAVAVIKNNQIILTSSEVSDPYYARYCWTNYGPVSVYGKNGLPLAPFRTSMEDGPELAGQNVQKTEIKQILEL